MITLVIVDCQNDFITGTMSVKGAKNSQMNKEGQEKISFRGKFSPAVPESLNIASIKLRM